MCFCYMGYLVREQAARTARVSRYPWTGLILKSGRRSTTDSIFDNMPDGWKTKIYRPINMGIADILCGKKELIDRAQCTAKVENDKLVFTFDCGDEKVNEKVREMVKPYIEKSRNVCQCCGKNLKKRADGTLYCRECDS